MVLGLLFLSLHPHHLSRFQMLRITMYCMLIWMAKVYLALNFQRAENC